MLSLCRNESLGLDSAVLLISGFWQAVSLMRSYYAQGKLLFLKLTHPTLPFPEEHLCPLVILCKKAHSYCSQKVGAL